MKICAIICEYNPFHNGHLYQIQQAKHLSNADFILCLMSGNFVQRGEAAIVEKHTRAKHAVLAGADIVVELPTVFATSNAELFAKGAIRILSSIPSVSTLSFGAENADKQTIFKAATLLNNEPTEISKKIKALTGTGISYAKARAQAWDGILPVDFLTSPNNILAIEYARAIESTAAHIDVLPIQRTGSGYKETSIREDYSSASAIRAAISAGSPLKNNLPPYVYADLPKQLSDELDRLEKYAILRTSPEKIASVCDCTEGLENAFKKAAVCQATLSETLTSARYTSSRIRRIALQNLLEIGETFIRECLRSPLYLRVLAANDKRKKELLPLLSNGDMPLLLRSQDKANLTDTAKQCLERDIFAEQVYGLLYSSTKETIFI